MVDAASFRQLASEAVTLIETQRTVSKVINTGAAAP